jgi:Domain of unknown function (DUF4432)
MILSRFILSVLCGFASMSLCHSDDVIRTVITSRNAGTNTEAWRMQSSDMTPECPHDWWISKSTLRGGRQEGVDIIVVNNGQMEIVLCPTRGMGILQVSLDDLFLKWDSPVKDVVNPQFVNLNSRGGLGWLEGFNEFMCRCGLESNGHPGTDTFINNVGDEAEMELTLHGRISNLPAQQVEIDVQQSAPWAITIRGQVDEKLLFGPKLELHSELVVIPGESTFTINDEIRNVGAQEQEFQILYHTNFGSPLLEEGAQVVVPAKSVAPFNDRAAEGMDIWNVYESPITGFVEQVYLLEPRGDQDNRATVLLHNKAQDKAASISWSLDELPYLTVWKNTGALADGYVTGIEPGTNYPNNRSVEREAGRVPKLAAGQSRQISLTFGLHTTAESVRVALNKADR